MDGPTLGKVQTHSCQPYVSWWYNDMRTVRELPWWEWLSLRRYPRRRFDTSGFRPLARSPRSLPKASNGAEHTPSSCAYRRPCLTRKARAGVGPYRPVCLRDSAARATSLSPPLLPSSLSCNGTDLLFFSRLGCNLRHQLLGFTTLSGYLLASSRLLLLLLYTTNRCLRPTRLPPTRRSAPPFPTQLGTPSAHQLDTYRRPDLLASKRLTLAPPRPPLLYCPLSWPSPRRLRPPATRTARWWVHPVEGRVSVLTLLLGSPTAPGHGRGAHQQLDAAYARDARGGAGRDCQERRPGHADSRGPGGVLHQALGSLGRDLLENRPGRGPAPATTRETADLFAFRLHHHQLPPLRLGRLGCAPRHPRGALPSAKGDPRPRAAAGHAVPRMAEEATPARQHRVQEETSRRHARAGRERPAGGEDRG